MLPSLRTGSWLRFTKSTLPDRVILAATLRVAAIQLTATPDLATNIAKADTLVREAADDRASLVLLPEWWAAGGTAAQKRAAAQSLDGDAIAWAAAIAAELKIDLIAGSVTELIEGEEKLHNTSVHLGPDGQRKAVYRKIHLFDNELEGASFRESDHQLPGDQIVSSEAADGTPFGLSICYDLRFPELYRLQAVEGAELLMVPACFTRKTTEAHWQTLLRARAIENHCFVVAANQVGEIAPGMDCGGDSMILDPWGTELSKADTKSEMMIVADLDFSELKRIRSELPSLASRQPHTYGSVQKGGS
jgi:predicted amidohydrolase